MDWSLQFYLVISILNNGEPAYFPEVSVNFNSGYKSQPPAFELEAFGCEAEVGLRDKFNCTLGKAIRQNEVDTHLN